MSITNIGSAGYKVFRNPSIIKKPEKKVETTNGPEFHGSPEHSKKKEDPFDSVLLYCKIDTNFAKKLNDE